MNANAMWEPTQEDFDTLSRTVGGRLKQQFPTVPPQRIDEQIEEIIQSGFLQYLEVISDDSSEEIRKPAHWVANAAFNKGMNALRDSGVRRKHENPTDAEGMEYAAHVTGGKEGRASGAINPVERVMSAEAMAWLLAAVNSLTARQVDVFVRCDIDHESRLDVAKELGVRANSIEKVLDAARSRVWWVVFQSNKEQLCEGFYTLIPGLDPETKPTKKQTQIIAKHIRNCDECRASICQGPLALDMGMVFKAGIIGGGAEATFAERITESPIIAKPVSAVESVWHSIRNTIDRIIPGSSQAAEAASSGLTMGGGQIAALCAGGAATVCIAAVGTGVVALPEAKSERERNREFVEKQIEAEQAAIAENPESVETVPVVDPRVTNREVMVQERVQEARRERVIAQRVAERKAAAKQAEKEAAAAAAAAETEQYTTNQSTAEQSFGISGSSSGSTTYSPPPSSSSSSSGGSSSAPPTPQQETNNSSAGASFGL